MKRFGVIFGLILILLFGAALAAPFLIDVNQYKGQIESAAQDALGREVEIKGDISIGFVTGPKLGLDQLIIANDARGDADAFLTMEEARVSIALLPLLSGTINVTEIQLGAPVIHFEQYADGANNLPLPTENEGATADVDQPAEEPSDDALPYDVVIGALTIKKGMVHYHDHANDSVEVIEIPALTVSLDSLDGPFSLNGQVTAYGQQIALSADVGNITQTKTRLRADVNLQNDAGQDLLTAKVSGFVADLMGAPQFSGVANIAGGPDDLIVVSFDSLSGSADEFDTGDGTVKVGDNKFALNARGVLGDIPDISVAVSAGRIDLPVLMASVEKVQAFIAKMQPMDDRAGSSTMPPAQDSQPVTNPLPQDMTVAFNLSVDALAMNDDAVRQIGVSGKLENGQLTLSNGSAQLPGSGQVNLILASGQPAAALSVDGTLDVAISDLPRFAKWAGIDLPADAQKGTYQQVTAKLPFNATQDAVAVRGLRMTLDRSVLSGAIDYDMRARPATVSYRLAVDQFNADDYMNTGTDPVAAQTTSVEGEGADADDNATSFPDIAVTGRFEVGALTYAGATYRNVLLQTDLTSVDNKVTAQFGFRAMPYQVLVQANYDPALGQASIDRMTFAANKSRLSGTALVTGMGNGQRPQFKAALSGPYLDMNEVMPATVDSQGKPTGGSTAPAKGNERWSKEQLPLAPLRTVDGTFTLALDRFIGFGLDIAEMKGQASLKKGVLKLEDVTGALFGGPMQANGTFDASTDQSSMLLDLTVKDADLEKIKLGFWRKGRFAGLVDGTMQLNSNGASMFDLVKGLKGDIKFAGEKGALRGMDLRKLATAVRNFDKGGAAQISSALTQGETPFNDLDMWLAFQDGVMTSKQIKTDVGSDVKVASDLMLDLPNWHANFTTGFFLVEKKDLPPISLQFKGPPDNLKRRLDTEAIQKHYVNSLVNKGVQKLFERGFKF